MLADLAVAGWLPDDRHTGLAAAVPAGRRHAAFELAGATCFGAALGLVGSLRGGAFGACWPMAVLVWLGVALLLEGWSVGLQALGQAGLGLAPLHAPVGYLGCTLVAMATRVASGHSGRLAGGGSPDLACYCCCRPRRCTAAWRWWEGRPLLLAAFSWAVVACLGLCAMAAGWGGALADGRPG